MGYDEIYDELYEWADNAIYGLTYSEERDKLVYLIIEVLLRIPSEDRIILEMKRRVKFVATTENCVAEQLFFYPNRDFDDSYREPIEVWLVCLSSDFFERIKEESIYTIAHELAHVYLGHSRHSSLSNSEEQIDREVEADRQVIKWNFEQELRQTPYNYIYGDGCI